MASFVLPAADASAEDGKVYPAAFCEGALVGNPPVVSFSVNGVTNNSTTNSAVLVCPAIKDNVTAVTGINEANFRYYKAGQAGVLIDLYSYSAYATSNYLSSKSDFGANGYKTLSWGALGSYSGGFYGFIVVLPNAPTAPRNRAISYRIDEND